MFFLKPKLCWENSKDINKFFNILQKKISTKRCHEVSGRFCFADFISFLTYVSVSFLLKWLRDGNMCKETNKNCEKTNCAFPGIFFGLPPSHKQICGNKIVCVHSELFYRKNLLSFLDEIYNKSVNQYIFCGNRRNVVKKITFKLKNFSSTIKNPKKTATMFLNICIHRVIIESE